MLALGRTRLVRRADRDGTRLISRTEGTDGSQHITL
jgi:hypothetical protein